MTNAIEATLRRQHKAQARAEHVIAEAWDKLREAEIVLKECGLTADAESQEIRVRLIAMLDRMSKNRPPALHTLCTASA